MEAQAPGRREATSGDAVQRSTADGKTASLALPSLAPAFRGLNAFGTSKAYIPVSSAQTSPETHIAAGRRTSESIPGNIEALPGRMAPEALRGLADDVRMGIRILAPVVQIWKASASPAEVAAFDRVRGAIARDPRAQLALDAMVESGRLTGSRPSLEGKTLLETLEAAATKQATPPLQMDTILADVVQDLADPRSINQGQRGTCTAGSLQQVMAHSDPAEYARVFTGLATGSGAVKLRGGQTLQREPESLKADDSNRTDASRLFQDAVIQMEVSIPGLDYRNPAKTPGKKESKDDAFLYRPDGSTVPSETDREFKTGKGVARVQTALTGIPHEELEFRVHPGELMNRDILAGNPEVLKLRQDMQAKQQDPSVQAAFDSYTEKSIARHMNGVFERMDSALEAGHPVSIGIETSAAGHEGHQISLVGKEKGSDGVETYLALNSWGTTHRFTREDLSRIMTAAVVPVTP